MFILRPVCIKKKKLLIKKSVKEAIRRLLKSRKLISYHISNCVHLGEEKEPREERKEEKKKG